MGNYKFRLSDMMPNAWFYKLKEIGARRRRTTRRNSVAKKQPPPPPPSSSFSLPPNSTRFSYPRKSYYFPREFTPNSPRKSILRTSQTNLDNNKKLKSKSKSSSSSSVVSGGCTCRAATLKSSDSPLPNPDYSASSSSADDSFRSDRILPVDKISADDIIINVDSKSLPRDFEKLNLSDRDLPPIVTKPKAVQFDDEVESMKMKKQKQTVEKQKSRVNSNRRHVSSPGLRLRVNSPRIGSRRIGGRKSVSSCSSSTPRRSLSDSVAIVKASTDPVRDFRESMVEMIVENNVKESKDLEDLLAAYLSLNSDEYHDLIIRVFKQIWVDLYGTPAAKK